MTESRLGSMSTISGEEMENDNGTNSPYAHSLDELDTGNYFSSAIAIKEFVSCLLFISQS